MGSKRTGVMLAYPLDEKKFSKLPEEVIFQRKLNGERMRVEWHSDLPVFYSSCGNEMPYFYKLKEELVELGYNGINFDGEMYCHGMDREAIHSICSRRVNQSSDEGLLKFHVFDVIYEEVQLKRLDLIRVDKNARFIEEVESYHGNKSQMLRYADMFIKEGYEGIIVRQPLSFYTPRKCNFLLKYKPTEEDNYRIVGWEEEKDIQGRRKGRLGSVVVEDGDGALFAVGTGNALDANGRQYWWEHRDSLVGKTARVKHSTITTVNNYPTCTSLLEIIIS